MIKLHLIARDRNGNQYIITKVDTNNISPFTIKGISIMKDVNEDVYNSAKNEVLSLGPNFPDIDVLFETMALRKKMEFAEYTNGRFLPDQGRTEGKK